MKTTVHRLTSSFALVAVLAGCGTVQELREPFRMLTAHERYAESLRSAGLNETALGRDWLEAAERSLDAPLQAPLPFREAGYFPADEAQAVGYRFRGERGQRFTARIELAGVEAPRIFVDLYEVPNEAGRPLAHRRSEEGADLTLTWEPRNSADYVLRVQPELLRAARYVVTIRSEAALTFPVEGRDTRAIGSGFGAARDGGRRVHHGVDIFAGRGTPVVAAAAGSVTRVDETSRGGKVVWVWDAERRQNLYYAHLDSQFVRPGARVQPGDTLGTVGNTGNARGTPPHLHFGIYRRGDGPLDPYPFLYTPRAAPPALTADTARLGEWRRTAAARQPLLAEPDAAGAALAELTQHTPLRLMGTSGPWLRVQLPDGRFGYVAARATDSAERPLRRERLTAAAAIRDRPLPGAAVVDSVPPGSSVPVLGMFAGFALVEGGAGRTGWVALP